MVLLALSLTLSACTSGEPFTPDYLPDPGGNTGTSGGGGGNAAELIVGSWEATIITTLPANDFITTKTTWDFLANGNCLQTIVSLQFSEGITHTTSTACTYSLGQGVLLVLYVGATLPTSYPISFPLNEPDQLVISGITYDRVT
jgi:hypothetical protein